MTIVPFSPEILQQACHLLAAGDVVAIPTETVYGLAADATNDQAVAKIYAIKQRPEFNPLIIHCHSASQARQYVEFTPLAEQLAERFWPGPLTLVLKRLSNCPISLLASAGLDTLAVRIPSHPVAQALIKLFGKPLAAPSANLTMTISPTCALDVQASLGSRVPLIMDGGATKIGVESTILDLSGPEPTLLRPGGISLELLRGEIGEVRFYHGTSIKAPGMMQRHYAPSARIRLNALERETPTEKMLGFGSIEGDMNLSPSGNLEEAAANLFRMMRELDDMLSTQKNAPRAIAVAPIPTHGLGLAINDRLTRAAHGEE